MDVPLHNRLQARSSVTAGNRTTAGHVSVLAIKKKAKRTRATATNCRMIKSCVFREQQTLA